MDSVREDMAVVEVTEEDADDLFKALGNLDSPSSKAPRICSRP